MTIFTQDKASVKIGELYGRLTVIGAEFCVAVGMSLKRLPHAVFTCDCGHIVVVQSRKARTGHTKSCGCWKLEKSKRPSTHGLCRHPLHAVWSGIVARCTIPSATGYRNYGGRGIKVCAEWREFKTFYDWAMANGWQQKLEIDRFPDNDGPYAPWNCRIVTHLQNGNRTRRCHFIDAFGETKTIAEWARDTRCAVSKPTLTNRINQYGWDAERAITTPSLGSGKHLRKRLPKAC